MTRKKQIIEILEKYSVKRVYFNSDDSICAERINVRDEVVDAILALDLDVPSDGEIKKEIFKRTTEPVPYTGKNYIPKPVFQFMEEISEWVKDEIIKRNK